MSAHHSLRGLDIVMQCSQPTHAMKAQGATTYAAPSLPTLLLTGIIAKACVGIRASTGDPGGKRYLPFPGTLPRLPVVCYRTEPRAQVATMRMGPRK